MIHLIYISLIALAIYVTARLTVKRTRARAIEFAAATARGMIEEAEAEAQRRNAAFADWSPADEQRYDVARAAAVQAAPPIPVHREGDGTWPLSVLGTPGLVASPSSFLTPIPSPRAVEVPLPASREGHAAVQELLSDPTLDAETKQVINQAADTLGEDVVAKIANKGQA